MPARESGERHYRVRGIDGRERAIGHNQIIVSKAKAKSPVSGSRGWSGATTGRSGSCRRPSGGKQNDRALEIPEPGGGSVPEDADPIAVAESPSVGDWKPQPGTRREDGPAEGAAAAQGGRRARR